ncbi:MAG: DUF2169 domain-containing protein, partial [Deltaproteobacteria bacterium]|nr:DUF2169 domain-containing protein [Deltaproteobacteria bacterium]
MKILKDDKLSVLHRSFYWRREHTLSVGVFAGFVLDEPVSLLGEPVMWKNAQESLARNQVLDVAMPKPGGEVLLAGVCCAPKGRELKAAEVSFRLGNIRKRLNVFGDRYWTRSVAAVWEISTPAPFTRMAITWENAFGGPAVDRNPVGKGIDSVETESGKRIRFL